MLRPYTHDGFFGIRNSRTRRLERVGAKLQEQLAQITPSEVSQEVTETVTKCVIETGKIW